MAEDENLTPYKRYRLLLLFIFLLLVLGVGCWYVKKYNPSKAVVQKDDVLRQLHQRNK
jgi:hypothetical protein